MRRALAALAVALPVAAWAAEPPAASEKIRDNLFLLEEAYNQEPGVIQHIQTLQLQGGGWSYSLTDEWPAPTDLNQLSFTLPLVHAPGSPRLSELGDVLINYRYQAAGLGGAGKVAFAPRLSLVLPTGDFRTGAGRGAPGLQVNLPVSLDLFDAFVMHLNAGFTLAPNARSPTGARGDAVDTALGAAFVWLPTHSVNGVLEVLHRTQDEFDAAGQLRRASSFVVNPGVRFAIDFPSGLQIVPGLSFPVELGRGRPALSVFTYLSFEHPLWH